jgi:hypothetical protein
MLLQRDSNELNFKQDFWKIFEKCEKLSELEKLWKYLGQISHLLSKFLIVNIFLRYMFYDIKRK